MCNCCKKGLLASAALFIFRTVAAIALCGGIFSWVYRLEPVSVWKAMNVPPGFAFFAQSFVLSVIFVFVYKHLNALLGEMANWKKGALYGLAVWAVGCLPGMWATYSFMTVNTTVVIYWTVLGLIQYPVEGIIVASIIGKAESCSIKK